MDTSDLAGLPSGDGASEREGDAHGDGSFADAAFVAGAAEPAPGATLGRRAEGTTLAYGDI
jgi:hypothetical protein